MGSPAFTLRKETMAKNKALPSSTALAVREPKHVLIGQEKTLNTALMLNETYFTARKHALIIAQQLKSIGGRCLEDKVLIMRARPDENYDGIVIPESAREKTEMGIVVAVGPGNLTESGRVELDVVEGDLVFFSKYYGTPREIANMEFLQLREPEIEYALGGRVPDPTEK